MALGKMQASAEATTTPAGLSVVLAETQGGSLVTLETLSSTLQSVQSVLGASFDSQTNTITVEIHRVSGRR